MTNEQKNILQNKNMAIIATLKPSMIWKAGQFLAYANSRGIPVMLYSGLRSFGQQWELRKKYITGKSGIAAKPGFSYHNFGYAFDCVPVDDAGSADWNSDKWDELGSLAPLAGLKWGGSFGDNVHFQDASVTANDMADFRSKSAGWQQYIKAEEDLLKETNIQRKPLNYIYIGISLIGLAFLSKYI